MIRYIASYYYHGYRDYAVATFDSADVTHVATCVAIASKEKKLFLELHVATLYIIANHLYNSKSFQCLCL